jgi:hypothetical protein
MLDSTKNSEAFESPLDKFLMASLYLRYNGAMAGESPPPPPPRAKFISTKTLLEMPRSSSDGRSFTEDIFGSL